MREPGAEPRESRWNVVVVPLLLTLGCTPGDAPWPFLDDQACRDEVMETLRGWRVADEFFGAAPTPTLARRYRLATPAIGEWVLLDFQRSGLPVLSRLGPAMAERHVYVPDCTATVTSEPTAVRKPAAGSAFSDEHLRTALDSLAEPALVVYLWSPHMPLSVDGYEEIAAASDILGLRLVSVLVPGSDRAFALAETARARLPDNAMREAASIELVMRDALVHAPSIIVFSPDRVSPVLPGYRNTEGYVRFLADFLAEKSNT